MSRFRHRERTGEQKHYLEWFKKNGYKIYGEDYTEFFEGGGGNPNLIYNAYFQMRAFRITKHYLPDLVREQIKM